MKMVHTSLHTYIKSVYCTFSAADNLKLDYYCFFVSKIKAGVRCLVRFVVLNPSEAKRVKRIFALSR